jgi:uncharacterized repeat protein (TIGR01451 family)
MLSLVAEEEIVVVNEKGEKEVKREPAQTIIPGDRVIYTMKFKNVGAENTDDVTINNAIPENMMLVAGTMGGAEADILYSVDNGQSYDLPENLKVPDETEEGQMRPAIARDYTNIRWRLKNSVTPGEEGEVFYRAEVK